MRKPTQDAPRMNAESSAKPEPIVVGIGASAGGLGALKSFFDHVPDDSGFSFVVVVHLAPEHKSHLADLLQPHVKIPVQQVNGTIQLQPNSVYVIPPGRNLSAIDTHLRLTNLEEKRRERAPIDHFFRTLAETHDGHAIGIVLTGTGTDGTLGIKEIKAKGGLVVVQDPNEAEYDGMPQSAIATGIVDYILRAEEIPEVLMRFARTKPQVRLPREGEDIDGDERHLLQKVFAQLRTHTGRDFSRYKPATILRRISRRMQLNQVEELPAYLERLSAQPQEVRALADDLLITVTSFFRDHEVFESLEKEVIPRLFEEKGDQSVRVWSVGCATGEEAYSLAMLLLEERARREAPTQIQIFASDLHEHSLHIAREGFYPGDIETDVSAERLRRFFQKDNGGYRIRKEVRELVVFAPHNLLADPPFSRLDLVSCRNLLIYLRREVQREVVELFHYSLKPDGYVILGASEKIEATELFRSVDKANKIHQKRNVAGPDPRLPVFPTMRLQLAGGEHLERPIKPAAFAALYQRMVEHYTPPSVLVGPDNKLVHVSAFASRYLVVPAGEPTQNVAKLVRQELQIDLGVALVGARQSRKAISSRPIPVQFNGEQRLVVAHVRPALEPAHEGFALVTFEERDFDEPSPALGRADEKGPAPNEEGRTSELESDLNLARQRLQAVIEEYETSQEEMKASNEEMQSTNEELRSTMEELETSKEELQSINEELQTVNQENRHKVEELALLTSDLQNLLTATDIATLFLDHDFRILRFTPKVGDLFNVRVTDRGRPITDLTHKLGYGELRQDAKAVLDSLIPVEREVQDEAGRWYLARVLPYRSAEDRIEGVVITFFDVTRRKQAEEDLRRAKLHAESVIEGLHEPLVVLTPDFRVKSANGAFYKHFMVNQKETEGRRIYALGNGQWNIPALRDLLENVLPENNVFDDFEVDHVFDDLGRRVLLVNARRLSDLQLIVLGIHDITEQKRAEEKAIEGQQRLAREVSALDRLNQMSLAVVTAKNFEQALDEILKAAMDLLRADFGKVQLVDPVSGGLRLVIQHGFDRDFVERFALVTAADGTPGWHALSSGRRIVVEDVEKDEAYAPYRDAAARAGFRAVQATPLLRDEDEVIGVLSTHFRSPRTISETDEQLVDLLARQTNALIQRLHAENELKALTDTLEQRVETATRQIREKEESVRDLASRLTMAEHQERDRIAQILHDDLQQLLYSIRLRFTFLREGIGSENGNEQLENVAKAEEWVDQAIRTTQQLAVDLSPQVLRNEGLVESLRWLAAQMEQLHGLRVRIDAKAGTLLSKAADILLFQSIRELLFNVVKHAETDEGFVDLSEADGTLRIRVVDRGKGFDVAEMKKHQGFGVLSIQHRVSLLGGEMGIESEAGKGTAATIELPIESIKRSA